ncbi:MAG: FIST N-terminal domain-containing protein [Verrucomicrobiota bacterium]
MLSQCLDGIEDMERFPPQLLILMASVSFKPFEQLLSGIYQELTSRGVHIPLIGCSVGGVVTESEVLLEGAVLVCLASRFITARVGVAEHVCGNNDEAIQSLCQQLGITGKRREDANPEGNRLLLCFLPGFSIDDLGRHYEASRLHEKIRNATGAWFPMVGGVAGDDFKQQEAWELAGDRVLTDSVVVALIESDVRFGIGMAHGLEGTGKFLNVAEVGGDGHSILRFEDWTEEGGKRSLFLRTPIEVLEAHRSKDAAVLFGGVTPETEERVIMVPDLQADGSAFVSRPVIPHWPVEVLIGQKERLRNTACQTAQSAISKGHLDPFHLAAAVGFACAGRYRFSEAVGLDVPEALKKLREQLRGAPFTAGLMHGEIGMERMGRSVMRNWTISGLLFGDELAKRSLHRLGYHALAEAGERLNECESTTGVLDTAMKAASEAGFPGGMISLVFKDRESHVIVAKNAFGRGWQGIVRRTRRRAKGGDLLDQIGQGRRWEFIPDSRIDQRCDPIAVRKSGVISQAVFPLLDAHSKLVGLLQIDLGDMSNLGATQLPEHLGILLSAIANFVATGICRSIRLDELRLSDLFDKAVGESLAQTRVAGAAQRFVDFLTRNPRVLGTDMIHVRLATSDGTSLQLIAGSGAYYAVARKERHGIPIVADNQPERSPTVQAFVRGTSAWVNDAKADTKARSFISTMAKGPLRSALELQQSYANIVIKNQSGNKPIGVVTIASERKWFFTESRLRSMRALGNRLFFAITHAREMEIDAARTNSELLVQKRLSYAGAIVAQITHDLLNRLNDILADVRSVADCTQAGANKERLARLERVCGELANRMNKYLEDIARGSHVTHELIDLGIPLNRAAERCAQKANDLNITVLCSGPQSVRLFGSQIQLEEAFCNVLDNGLNAMPCGGTLAIAVQEFPAEGCVRAFITDQGHGMPQAEIDRVHRNELRLSPNERPSMGLFLSKFLIEQHCGTIRITSPPGSGTTVTITLPTRQQAERKVSNGNQD